MLENYLFIDFNKKYNHFALRFCVFLYITEWPWSNFLYATPLEFRRCAKHAIKITNGKKINVAYWNILKKNHLNIHLYFSTLFNNFWILIFLKSQKGNRCKVLGSRGFPNFYEGWKWRHNVEKCAWRKIDEIRVWAKFEWYKGVTPGEVQDNKICDSRR